METKTEKKSIIEVRREQFQNNEKRMIDRLGFDRYWDLFLDAGTAFLRGSYTPGKRYYEYHYKSALYWSWFYSEWKLWEDELVQHLLINEHLEHSTIADELMNCSADGEVEQSFHANYLRHQKTF